MQRTKHKVKGLENIITAKIDTFMNRFKDFVHINEQSIG